MELPSLEGAMKQESLAFRQERFNAVVAALDVLIHFSMGIYKSSVLALAHFGYLNGVVA